MSNLKHFALHIRKEHKETIEKAEEALKQYNEILLSRIEKDIIKKCINIEPTEQDFRKAREAFLNDQIRIEMSEYIAKLYSTLGSPMFVIDKEKT